MAYSQRVLPVMLPVVLVHGGLYEGMTSREFWADTGVLGELKARHLRVLAPQRPMQPRSWDEERRSLLEAIDAAGYSRVALVGASNGCSAAARLAIENPDRVARMMLAWPATVGDPVVDELLGIIITDEADEAVARDLLSGETLRGVSDGELAALELPVVVLPSLIENQVHQRQTLMGILANVSDSFLVAGSPEPPDDQFPEHLDAFATMVAEFAREEHDD
jgi:pimeloyl-ACP methyl ester carboxylesterase